MPDGTQEPLRLIPAKHEHLGPEEVVHYLHAVIDPAGRRRIEAHLVRCDRCLDEVIAVLRQVRPRERPPLG
jgi:hypothetical protein